MFSYRHAFHAGNHADVLKHSIFVHILDHYNRKAAPYWVIDTHAGGGLYDLRHDWATQTAEVADGLDRILGLDDCPPLIERYLDEVEQVNPDGYANVYPGSPWLALQAMRGSDRLRLFELHPGESDVLRRNINELGVQTKRQCMIHEADGFTGLAGLLPPATRRAITIIDPSYEDKTDYRRVLSTIDKAVRRFATGCYVIWYPKVSRPEPAQMLAKLQETGTPWLHASLTVRRPPPGGHGMYGSGVFVLNPPWTLHKELSLALPWLVRHLAQDDRARYQLDQYTGEGDVSSPPAHAGPAGTPRNQAKRSPSRK